MCGLDVLLINVKTYCKQAKPSVNAKLVPDRDSKVINITHCFVLCAAGYDSPVYSSVL